MNMPFLIVLCNTLRVNFREFFFFELLSNREFNPPLRMIKHNWHAFCIRCSAITRTEYVPCKAIKNLKKGCQHEAYNSLYTTRNAPQRQAVAVREKNL